MRLHPTPLAGSELSEPPRRPRVVVLGAGIAGLAAAHRIATRAPHVELQVLEAAERPGGLVHSERTDDGLLVEHGPDCLLTFKPEGLSLARELGLDGELLAGAAGQRSYVCRGTRMVPTPTGLVSMAPSSAWPMFRSPLLSWRGKLRLMAEPWVTPGGHEDESVASFVTRRFGREFLEQLVAPLLEAIHRTPVDRLSVQAALPALVEMERRHGSIARALHARARSPRLPRTQRDLPPVVTLRTGMAALPHALARALGERIRYRTRVKRLHAHAAGGYRIELEGGATLRADGVVLALPAYAAASVVAELDAALSADMARLHYGPLRCITLAWHREDVPHPLQGTGFVVPSAQRRAITACTWSSTKWPERAPASRVLMRAFLREDLDDPEAMRREACRELSMRLGIRAAPPFVRIHSLDRALPRRDVGCLERWARMHERAGTLASFALAGHAYGGSSLPDCIGSGFRAADEVVASTTEN